MEQAIRTGNYFVTADRQARTLDQGQTRAETTDYIRAEESPG